MVKIVKRSHNKWLKNFHLPGYSFPKQQRAVGGLDFDCPCLLYSHRRLRGHVSSERDQTVERIVSVDVEQQKTEQTGAHDNIKTLDNKQRKAMSFA